jgi:CRISPR-associated protein Cas5d
MSTQNKLYEVQFEIEGTAAMFTRPDTGATPVSYPAPTYSAAKGMFESIARLKSAYIRPTKVEICAPIHYHRYTNNYHGPSRKGGTDNFQLFATILTNVCYRIYGVVEELERAPIKLTTNHLHYLKDKFDRRLRNGRWYYIPCLGWKEFTPSYVGIFRENTKVEESIEQILPSMLFSIKYLPSASSYDIEAKYKQDVWIKKGVLEYVE